MPDVIRNAWFAIWQMTPADLGGQRTYGVDHQGIVIDIYIGIK